MIRGSSSWETAQQRLRTYRISVTAPAKHRRVIYAADFGPLLSSIRATALLRLDNCAALSAHVRISFLALAQLRQCP
jgi:hypothetical protein